MFREISAYGTQFGVPGPLCTITLCPSTPFTSRTHIERKRLGESAAGACFTRQSFFTSSTTRVAFGFVAR
jgi:hypothetical protein